MEPDDLPILELDEGGPARARGLGRVLASLRRLPPAVLLASALGLLALVESATAIIAPRLVATPAQWKAAAAEVRSGFRDGDLIVIAPRWEDQVGRLYLGDLLDAKMEGREDASRYGRVWEVSIRGARARETLGPDARLIGTDWHGHVRVSLYRKAPPVKVLADLTTRLVDARVTTLPSGGKAGGERPCFHNGRGVFRCRSTTVEHRTLEIDYRPRRGVLVPLEHGLVTRIEWDKVPLGDALVGHTGMHDYYARKNADGPVEFGVFIDGQPVYAGMQRNRGWNPLRIDTRKYGGGLHTIRLEIESAEPAWRNFGFQMETIDDPPAAAPEPNPAGPKANGAAGKAAQP